MSSASTYDAWLSAEGPAALVIREHMIPVEGADGVFFPATFAASEDTKIFKGGYNIDTWEQSGRGSEHRPSNVCLVDSVGSQANRTETLFAKEKYAGLVPQIVIVAGTKRVNLLEAGHRAGDALVRCSDLKDEIKEAFAAFQKGDAEPLARLAPTSLVFGVWDSRGTQAKSARLFSSTIRAFDVQKLTRSAVYMPSLDYVDEGLLDDSDDKKVKDAYSARGYQHAPASASHGGVMADGDIRRDATLHLSALRLLSAASGEKTTSLRRYILGLSLVALTHPPTGHLRQGCNLVLDPDKKSEFLEVHFDGRRAPVKVTHEQALEYARHAARSFGINPDRSVDSTGKPDREAVFSREAALGDVSLEGAAAAKTAKTPRKKG